jgi:hypothetical protein
MTDGSGATGWPRCATEEELARLAPPARVAEAIGPMVSEVVRIYGGLPRIPMLAAIIAEAVARSPLMQEFDLAEIGPEDALAIAESVHLITNEKMERF